MSLNCQVAIIGAGPYGLSAAAHLLAAQTDVRIFGKPMELWRNGMPQGMVLRSPWHYCHIADPHDAYTVARFAEQSDLQLPLHLGLEQFLRYGDWFQRQLVPNIDGRLVIRIERTVRGFLLVLRDGETCAAQRVVVATGLAHHERRPQQFNGLPRTHCTHTSEHNRFAPFAGRRVAVVGGGQAGLESAVLLREAGADVEVIVRAPYVCWQSAGNGAADILRRTIRPFIRRFMRSPLIGTFPLNYILERPDWFRRVPAGLQDAITRQAQRPSGTACLLPRAAGLQITTGTSIVSAASCGSHVGLKLADGSQRTVDHVLLATGYRFDISNLRFLPAELVPQIRCARGYPILSKSMESSVPGLHFIGVPASGTFGPVLRFVYGTRYSSHQLTRGICEVGGTKTETRLAVARASVQSITSS